MSVDIEFLLLIKIYHEFPALARKAHLEENKLGEKKEGKTSLVQKLRKPIDSWVMVRHCLRQLCSN